MKIAIPRLARMSGDGVAEVASMGRVDLISLMVLVSSILLLAGMALAIPADPFEFASICRSRTDGPAAKAGTTPATSDLTRRKTTSTP